MANTFLENIGLRNPEFNEIGNPLFWAIPSERSRDFALYPRKYGFTPAFLYLPEYYVLEEEQEDIHGFLFKDVGYFSLTDNVATLQMTRNIHRFEGYRTQRRDLYVVSEALAEILPKW